MKKIFAMAIVAIAAVSANASTVEATWEAEPAATHPIPPVEVAAEPAAWTPEAGYPAAWSPVTAEPEACHPEAGFPVAWSPVAAEPVATHPIPPVEVAAEPVAWQPEAGFPVACHPESFPVGSWPKEPVKVLA